MQYPAPSRTPRAWASPPALGRAEPAQLNWPQTPGWAQPPSLRLELFWLPGLSAARNAAGGRCLRVTPRLRRRAAAWRGDTERGWGWGSRGEHPPHTHTPCRGAAEEREVLYGGSRAGAGRASSPNRSPPANRAAMTKGGGGLGWLPAEEPSGGRVPVQQSRPKGGAPSRDPAVWAALSAPTQRQCPKRGAAGSGADERFGTPAMVGWLQRPSRGSGVAVGARRAASRSRQRCRPRHEPRAGSRAQSSSSLRLLEEAISGRAGNSYHSLLTPGRQEGEPASPATAPPQSPHALPQGPAPAKPAPRVPGTLGHPRAGPRDVPKRGTCPMPRAAPNPAGWLHPCPAPTGEEGRGGAEVPAPRTPMSASVVWGSPSQVLSGRDLCDHINHVVSKHRGCARPCAGAGPSQP